MRVLDEVAEAIRLAGGRSPRPLVSAFGLREQFDQPLEPNLWIAIQRHLACPLPLLEFAPSYGFRPVGFETIWDLVDRAACFHSNWNFRSNEPKRHGVSLRYSWACGSVSPAPGAWIIKTSFARRD